MDLSNIIYYIKSGINDARHNSAMAVSSIIIVISGLCILGIYSLMSMNISYIGDQLCSKYTITAYIEKGVTEERAEEIKNEIKSKAGVRDVTYESEAQALENCRQMFSDKADFLTGLDADNPLRASMIISINNISESQKVSEEVSGVQDIAWVKDDSNIAGKLTSSTAVIRRSALVLFVIFLGIALFIIANTIRITILARQEDIHTMRYLGATNKFIVMPFIFEGITIGFLGAVIAYIAVMSGYVYASGKLTAFINGMINIYSVSDVALKILVECIGSGIIIGGLSTIIPLMKHIRV